MNIMSSDCPTFPRLKEYVEKLACASISCADALVSGSLDIAVFPDGMRESEIRRPDLIFS